MTEHQGRIMVVDDDLGMRVTLEGVIEDEGYEVVAVEDGYQAIEMVRQTEFALIFMDIKMPGLNGVETYREIRKISPDSVVVMMTGFSVEDLVKESLEVGAYSVIYKPFDMAQVIEIVEAVLETTCVLVVDDRAADRITLQGILEDEGYDVFVAQHGSQAVSMVREKHYRVILMDIKMPGMDGISAFEEIRKIDPQVKVIFVTGYAMDDAVKGALKRGAYSLVIKPVRPEEMLTLMKAITQ